MLLTKSHTLENPVAWHQANRQQCSGYFISLDVHVHTLSAKLMLWASTNTLLCCNMNFGKVCKALRK